LYGFLFTLARANIVVGLSGSTACGYKVLFNGATSMSLSSASPSVLRRRWPYT